jgi:hypothetical protein
VWEPGADVPPLGDASVIRVDLDLANVPFGAAPVAGRNGNDEISADFSEPDAAIRFMRAASEHPEVGADLMIAAPVELRDAVNKGLEETFDTKVLKPYQTTMDGAALDFSQVMEGLGKAAAPANSSLKLAAKVERAKVIDKRLAVVENAAILAVMLLALPFMVLGLERMPTAALALLVLLQLFTVGVLAARRRWLTATLMAAGALWFTAALAVAVAVSA